MWLVPATLMDHNTHDHTLNAALKGFRLMTYQALARKWRPRSFQDVVGQPSTLRILTHALEKNRLHHAYLFTGTRGVGKTTLARILAKCLNCENGVTPAPCGHCANCQAIDTGQFLDLYEIDAASRTKVEDTRDLLDNVAYPPTMGRYKIYLIDEVHMLSQHSFNALLKTLEEPPAHVKFLLATTDPKRLPVTILSRCLQFHLKHISAETIAERLTYISQQEQITHEKEALYLLAKAANGSMRDALSLLDQAIAFGAGQVNTNDVNSMLGNVSQQDVIPLLEALHQQNGAAVMNILNNMLDDIGDANVILEETIAVLHTIAMAQMIPQYALDHSACKQLATQISPETIQLYYQIALLGRRDLGLAPSPRQGIEMVLLRMLAFTLGDEKLTSKMQAQPNQAIQPAPTEQNHAPVTLNAAPPDSPNWRNIVQALGLSGMAHIIASNCILTKQTDNSMHLLLSKQHAAVLNDKLKERLQSALAQYFGKAITLAITISDTELMTPAKEVATEKTKEHQEAKEKISKHPLIKHFLDRYDTTLDINTTTIN